MPYVLQWHLSTQYELTGKTMFEVAYVGSKADRSYIYLNGNQAQPTADPSAATAPRRPFPYVDAAIGYLRSSGSSNYNGLQTSFQQRLARDSNSSSTTPTARLWGTPAAPTLDRRTTTASATACTPIRNTARSISMCGIVSLLATSMTCPSAPVTASRHTTRSSTTLSGTGTGPASDSLVRHLVHGHRRQRGLRQLRWPAAP